MTGDRLVTEARRFLHVREEGGPNRGLWVELFLRFTGNAPGDSWCASFVSYLLNLVYRGKSPVVRTAGTHELLADCRAKGLIVAVPRPGDLVFSMTAQGEPHHVAICTRAVATDGGPLVLLTTIAGNTSEDGVSANGDRVAEHDVRTALKVYARLPEAA